MSIGNFWIDTFAGSVISLWNPAFVVAFAVMWAESNIQEQSFQKHYEMGPARSCIPECVQGKIIQ